MKQKDRNSIDQSSNGNLITSFLFFKILNCIVIYILSWDFIEGYFIHSFIYLFT